MASNAGLSKDIELSIQDLIRGLDFTLDTLSIEDNKMKSAIKSKLSSFDSAKKLLQRWMNSPNAPTKTKIDKYARDLIKAGNRAKVDMRNALRKKINYADLDADKHAAAVEAKPYILDSIHQLNSGIVELELQVDTGEYNFSEKEFKIGWPERMARGELFPKREYHKDWYNAKEDAVKICPYGSEGEIIELHGLKIQLPEPPLNKNKIINYGKPKSEQYWRREPVPAGLTVDNEEEFTDYIVEEFRRRVEGVWFMNNGKATYITGHMYFWLQWYKDIDSGEYSNFREAQNLLTYHTKACEVDKRCLGQVFVKSRRTGLTLEKLARKLNMETISKNFRSGLTSKTGEDAEQAFKKKQYAFQELPYFFKPVVKGRTDSDVSITFAKPSDASKEAKKRKDNDNSDYLNTFSDFRKTNNGAYDSEKLNDYFCDEFSKWLKPNDFGIHWKKVRPTLDQNGIIVGKAWLGSTTEDATKGGQVAIDMWGASDPRKRNKVTKRTRTGLYRYFMGAHENSAYHIDKFGHCHQVKPKGNPPYNQDGEPIEHGAIEYYDNMEKEARQEGQEKYNEYKRNHPRKVEDAFRMSVSDSAFNLENINEQIEYNYILDNEKVRRGNFMWKRGEMDTEVVFELNPDGRFWVTWLPPKELRNKFEWEGSQRKPKNHWLGAGGLDPFGKDQTADKRQSNGSFHFINRVNAQFPETNKMFVLEYVHRPPTRAQFFEDALMASFYFGYPIFAENDKDGIITYFEQRGYLGYLMKRPNRYKSKSSRLKDEIGAPGTGMMEPIYYALNDYINTEVGNTKNGMGKMFFNRTLEDWGKFEPNNRTAYDASISSGMALCAIQVEIEERKEVKVQIEELPFKRYDNRGNYSRKVK